MNKTIQISSPDPPELTKIWARPDPWVDPTRVQPCTTDGGEEVASRALYRTSDGWPTQC
jgi:hypothetical protein